MPTFTYGGQALIEGVLMRGRDAIAVALRHPDGHIVYATERLDSGFHGTRWSKFPFIRGLVVLYETLIVGTRWLVRSANVQAQDEGVELGKGSVALMLGLTLVAGVGIFFLLPLFVASVTTANVENGLVQHFVEGLIRVVIFLGYLAPDRARSRCRPGLPVPRRGAHDHPRARGRRPADGRPRSASTRPRTSAAAPSSSSWSSSCRSSRSRWSAGSSRWS